MGKKVIKKVVVKRVREKVGQNDAQANKDNTDKTTLGDMKGLDKKRLNDRFSADCSL